MASIESSSGDDDGGEVAPEAKGLLGATMNVVSGALDYITGSKQDGGKEVGPVSYTECIDEWEHISKVSMCQYL